ncbi:ribonuclease Z [Janthinobacterium sp. 1_2014MBL_MicDiv]|uniref:ribonuclease Z n=1 Tax=Janthinobacterium sp. 1_2014MBL_MicDiv TaxID=1644131 RepID=UPI0008F4D773|nr:ribonuclease Z [Janthinobacterium sp. 1_2014MBL_MicDiv]APA69467.1 beta-lactamase [Janthinobacterium sp. 1_2014MBL_MicDiv]
MFKLTFLGTSSGVPTRYRNVTSLALQTTHNRDWWMIDCGEATQHRLQRIPLSVHDLVGICITHVHGDHSYGLPGLLASASMTGRTKPLLLIAPAAIKTWIDATLLHTELFLTYPLIHIDVDSAPVVHEEAGLRIERHALSHRAPSVAYRFALETSKWKLDKAALQAAGVAPGPAWGLLQTGHDARLDDGTLVSAATFRQLETQRATVVIGGDNDTPALLAEACTGAQLLVHEATYTEAMLQKVGPGPTHSSVQRVAQFAESNGLPNLILTHFSARYHNPAGMAELEAEARLHYSGQLFLARDFDSYELDAAGVLGKLDTPHGK